MRLLLISLCTMILISCGEVKRLDTSKIKDKMESYKVKQIRPDEMMSQVRILGQQSENSLSKRISCRDLEATMDSISMASKSTIEMVDVSLLSISDSKDQKEKMLYEAYIYAFEQNEQLPSNAQKLANGTFVYSFGVKSDAILCDTMLAPSRYFWKMTWTQRDLLQSF